MKTRFLAILLLAATYCSCSPYLAYIPIEMQGPSYTNNFLWNKSIAIAYDEAVTDESNAYMLKYANGFAKGLDSVCSNGGKKVEVFMLPKSDSTVFYYNTKEGLLKLLMDLGTDVVIYIPQPVFLSGQLVQYLYLYDSKSSKDKVYFVKKFGDLTFENTTKELSEYAHSFGLETALAYQPNWIAEEFPIYTSSAIGNSLDIAYDCALKYNWKEAISRWLEFTKDENTPQMKSMAAFNIAVGCFFEGQYSLAKEWLEFSDKVYKLPESDNLRKKFELYIN